MKLALHSEVNGNDESPVVIILHGLFGSTSNWRSIARKLAGNNRVICLDLRNHGKSPWHDQMDYLDLAGDVAEFIERNDIETPDIIGHSMGGKTAMTLLQEFPLQLGKVIVVDIAPVRYFHDHDAFIHAMQSTAFGCIETRRQVEQHLAESVPEPAVRQFLMQNLERKGDKFRWRINLDAIANNMPNIMGFGDYEPTQAGIVFIAGKYSNYILPDHQETIMRNFPNARIETIQGAGHWLHAEKPQAFLTIVNKYLES